MGRYMKKVENTGLRHPTTSYKCLTRPILVNTPEAKLSEIYM